MIKKHMEQAGILGVSWPLKGILKPYWLWVCMFPPCPSRFSLGTQSNSLLASLMGKARNITKVLRKIVKIDTGLKLATLSTEWPQSLAIFCREVKVSRAYQLLKFTWAEVRAKKKQLWSIKGDVEPLSSSHRNLRTTLFT